MGWRSKKWMSNEEVKVFGGKNEEGKANGNGWE